MGRDRHPWLSSDIGPTTGQAFVSIQLALAVVVWHYAHHAMLCSDGPLNVHTRHLCPSFCREKTAAELLRASVRILRPLVA